MNPYKLLSAASNIIAQQDHSANTENCVDVAQLQVAASHLAEAIKIMEGTCRTPLYTTLPAEQENREVVSNEHGPF